MIGKNIINKVIEMEDLEQGGEHALDGFEFQISSAIYLMFDEIKSDNEFCLVYEKVEDFIIFNDHIHLYQAKSISRNLTPKLLYTNQKITKKNNSSLSIIEKMQDNYLCIKEAIPKYKVDNTLIICENQTFSGKLTKEVKNIESIRKFGFNNLNISVRNEIINSTKHKDYDWDNIYALRLIPKSRHEEVTRVFLTDVIKEKLGENKINSQALYNAISNEIRRIRHQKKPLHSNFLMNQIKKFAVFENDIDYNAYTYLLNDNDKMNIIIRSNFNLLKNTIMIENHSDRQDYLRFLHVFNKYNFLTLYDFYNNIINNTLYQDIVLRNDIEKIKALIMLVIVKESI